MNSQRNLSLCLKCTIKAIVNLHHMIVMNILYVSTQTSFIRCFKVTITTIEFFCQMLRLYVFGNIRFERGFIFTYLTFVNFPITLMYKFSMPQNRIFTTIFFIANTTVVFFPFSSSL